MKESLALARKEAVKKLAAAGIEDKIVVKLHAITVGPEAVGQYRGGSQFRGAPVFWISNDAAMWDQVEPADLVRGMTITILHEYGHVIWEYLRVRSSTVPNAEKLWDDLRALSMGSEDEDEEEFAEAFAQSLYWSDSRNPVVMEIARRYGTLLHSAGG